MNAETMIATESRCTVEDYRKLPPDDWRYQLIDGEIVTSPSPKFFHQRILMNLLHLLRPVDDKKLGQLLCAPLDFYLDDHNVYQPDVMFVSREREEIVQEDGFHGAPDFIIEILSARTARYDRNQKRAGYARSGVREMWLVYPEAKQVEVFHFEKDAVKPAASYSLGDKFRLPLFPSLEISVEAIFAR